jgi:hypothetical protein
MRRVTSRARFLVPAAALLLGPVLMVSCGPSVQSIYEGDVRFEHCYRLDLELDVATTHRQACWTTWLDRYTYGQSRDRLEYARRRVRAFGSGDVDRPTLRLGANEAEDTRQFYLVVPQPTSVHAPPPPIAAQAAPVPSDKPAPGEDCAGACKNAFTSCNQACAAAAKSAACKSCDPDYKQCMARCFE